MDIAFKWIGGATFILTAGNLVISVDPVLCRKGKVQDYFWFKSERIEEPVYLKTDFDNSDLWLITHNHEDHLDNPGLSKIQPSSRIVCNKNSSGILLKNGKNNIAVLNWNQKTEFTAKDGTIEIEAIPAVHGINPLSSLLAGKGNGYYLVITLFR